MEKPEERMAFSVAEVAGFMGISSRTVWNLIKSGELPSFRVGARVLMSKSALEQFIAQRTVKGGEPC
jgi:excisionase family DNA binding protein